MTVEELIEGLKNYKGSLNVFMRIEGEQGRSGEHWPIVGFSVEYVQGEREQPTNVLLLNKNHL